MPDGEGTSVVPSHTPGLHKLHSPVATAPQVSENTAEMGGNPNRITLLIQMYNLRGNPKETQVRNLAAKAEVVKTPTNAYRIHGNASIVQCKLRKISEKHRYTHIATQKRDFKVMSIALTMELLEKIITLRYFRRKRRKTLGAAQSCLVGLSWIC